MFEINLNEKITTVNKLNMIQLHKTSSLAAFEFF